MTEPSSAPGPLPPYRHVVVGVDGSEAAVRAARTARALASAIGASLHLFRADLGIDDVAPEVEAEVGDLAEELEAVPATTPLSRAPGRPGRLIAERVAELDPAVACLGSHGRGAIGAALLGSTTSGYLAHSGRPAVVCGPDAAAGVAPERVALCADGSDHAAALLPEALRWASGLGVALAVVTATSDAPAVGDGDAAGYVEALEARAGGTGVDTTAEVVRGNDPRQALLAYLAVVPTLGVLATHGRSAIAATMLGGTAGALVRNASGPLVLRRPPSLPPVGATAP